MHFTDTFKQIMKLPRWSLLLVLINVLRSSLSVVDLETLSSSGQFGNCSH